MGGGWQLWVTLTRSGQCSSPADRLDFRKQHEALAPLRLSRAQGVLWVNACLQRLFTGQPESPLEMQGRRVYVACRHFSLVLESFLSQGCAVGGCIPGGTESRILSYPLLKTYSLGSPKALAWAESWHQTASRAVLSQGKCHWGILGRERGCHSNKAWFFCVGG